MREKIVELANEALSTPLADSDDEALWEGANSSSSEQDWLDAIDKGDGTTTAKGKVWALDPIDGTKGFLRQGQYAVCLALLLDGEPVLGVMGCPNLPVDFSKPDSETGVLFVAVKGEGAFQVGLPLLKRLYK